jgi:hypothetical protein
MVRAPPAGRHDPDPGNRVARTPSLLAPADTISGTVASVIDAPDARCRGEGLRGLATPTR